MLDHLAVSLVTKTTNSRDKIILPEFKERILLFVDVDSIIFIAFMSVVSHMVR